MAHILPHWTWPERVGQVTPVHVYTSGDEAELFLNGKSLGRKKKAQYEYRLRWDSLLADVRIEVQTTGAEVELKGTVKNEAQRRRAGDIAETTAGVLAVNDSLKVEE